MIGRKKVIVLGGGISGLCAAWRLAENGFDVELYEKEPYVGGLATTFKKDNYLLDFGPHPFYTEDTEILDTFKELIGNDVLTFERNCLLSFNNSYIHYPPQASDILFNMGFKAAIYSTLSYVKSQFNGVFKSLNERTFEEWAVKSFGRYLYEIFFGPYTEQFWKIPSDKLADDWADVRVAKLNLFKTITLLLFKGKAAGKLNQIVRDTLPLYYPAYGCGMLPERIAEKLEKSGGRIFLSSPVTKVMLNNPHKYFVEVNSGQNKKLVDADLLISTTPLKHLVNSIIPSPDKKILAYANSLKSMGLIVLFLVVKKKSILPVPYMYFFDRIYHRITEYNKFSEKLSPEDENLLSVEISCYEGDQYWNSTHEELSELCIKELIRDGHIKRDQIKNIYVLKSDSAYPVYILGYHAVLRGVREYIQQFNNLYLLGRNGSFTYIDQDQAMRMGFDLGDRIAGNHSNS